ncbi:MAG: hypothetical protein LUF30_04245 [Lachnospiraceae bacterium]|nr:hypothetical protein [Lachnospiraceae bacterium]
MKPDFLSMNGSQEGKTFSSAVSMDMDKEFMYAHYPYLRKENSPRYGVGDASEIVFHTMDFDELCYMLSSEGTHLVLFGGIWSDATQSVIDRINYYAKKYNVDSVHLYDFSSDGSEAASIKRDVTERPGYDGPGKREENAFAIFSYLYGEVVRKHLTNLNDWVAPARKRGHLDDITFLDMNQEAVSVPNLREPFLFLFNKDNTVDNSGLGQSGGIYPIVWAAELEAYRDDSDDELYADPNVHSEATRIADFDALLEEKIFSHIGENGLTVTSYTAADYIIDAFAMNGRGHCYKTQDAFEKGEQINIQKINFQEFYWMIHQKGTYITMFAGPWCAYSQGASATVNDYAVANDLRVYMSDIRLDSKHAIDFWCYGRQNEITISCEPMRKYYIEIWENLFEQPEVDWSHYNPAEPWTKPKFVEYTDETGKVHSVPGVGVPHLQAYCTGKGTLAFEHGAFELINCGKEFIYEESHYKEYKTAVHRIFSAYADNLGIETKEITIDRTAPVVEGQRIKHPEYPRTEKEHNWYEERAARANLHDENDCCF